MFYDEEFRLNSEKVELQNQYPDLVDYYNISNHRLGQGMIDVWDNFPEIVMSAEQKNPEPKTGAVNHLNGSKQWKIPVNYI